MLRPAATRDRNSSSSGLLPSLELRRLLPRMDMRQLPRIDPRQALSRTLTGVENVVSGARSMHKTFNEKMDLLSGKVPEDIWISVQQAVTEYERGRAGAGAHEKVKGAKFRCEDVWHGHFEDHEVYKACCTSWVLGLMRKSYTVDLQGKVVKGAPSHACK